MDKKTLNTEKLCLDVIRKKLFAESNLVIMNKDLALALSKVTQQIAIEFAQYYFRETFNIDTHSELKTDDQIFEEFLKQD